MKREISIIEIEDDVGKEYRVVRKISRLSIEETITFHSRNQAMDQFERWLE